MNFKIIHLFIALLISLSIISCSENCDQSDRYSDMHVDIQIDRLENDLQALNSWEETVLYMNSHRMMSDFFLDAIQYPNDTILAKKLFGLIQHPSIDSLFDETDRYFVDFDVYEKEFETAFEFIQYNYPKSKLPRIETVVTGFYNDMYVSDSLVVLGLDFFMGNNGRYHSNDVPMYIIKRYMRESMVPMVLSFISNEYNQTDELHGTLLADMVNLGKSYYFVSEALPCKPDSLIIGYTTDEIGLVKANQEVIWATFIENELLYEKNHFIKNKFVGESPNVFEISEKCPGRIGAWIGWEIVKKYMDTNPDVTLVDLMKERDAHKIFQLSGYKPKNVIE
ncbi:MAG: gliding motility lipoprotein GldB [Reichenbachiella sp.]